jgi:hypothetical protein
MLAHLLSIDIEPLDKAASSFVPVDDADAGQILNAKITSDDWLRSMGADAPTALDPAYERALATQAVGAALNVVPSLSEEDKKKHMLDLRTPEAVRHTVAMLTAYEWSFVEHAQQIRSYIVSGLMDETKNPKPDIRLKAYKMLGDVTEVALFTQRMQVVTRDLSDEQIEQEIHKRLESLTVNPNTPLVHRVDSDVDDA